MHKDFFAKRVKYALRVTLHKDTFARRVIFALVVTFAQKKLNNKKIELNKLPT